MNGILLILGINTVVGLVLMALHNYRRASWIISTFGSLLLGLITLWGPFSQPLVIGAVGIKFEASLTFLGRRLVIDGANQFSVAYIYLASAFLFGGSGVARPARFFFSAGIFAVLAMALALMVDPFLYAAIFLEVAAFATIFVLVDPQRPAIQSALRILLFYTLGMMAILMAGWLLDTSGVTTGAPELVSRVSRYLLIGFGVLLMVPPFHLWLPSAADSSDKYSLIFSIVLLYSAGLFILLRFMNEFEWLRSSAITGQAIQGAGLVMVLIGGLWALAQRDIARAFVFILMVDFGATMLVLSLGQSDSYSLALVISGARIISAGVWGLGASIIDRVVERGASYSGIAYSNTLPMAAVLVGMLSLAGFPLTAGFPGRWGAIQLIHPGSTVSAMAMVLGIGFSAATALRWLGKSLAQPQQAPGTITLNGLERSMVAMGLAFCLVLGIFPQLFYPWLSQALIGLENLIK